MYSRMSQGMPPGGARGAGRATAPGRSPVRPAPASGHSATLGRALAHAGAGRARGAPAAPFRE